jgi:DNA helicase-2/ATP-dependent DNA helicase PcrA
MESRESIYNEIDWATARRLNPETYPEAATKAERNPSGSLTQISEYLHLFIQEKKKRNLIDFDDILEYAIRYLVDDPDYAATRHWKYRYIFVDEFQDVNPLQFALLRAWLGVDSSICVVGDPDQAIYSWNGADARYLQNFNDYFPNSKTVVLDDNFRSTPQIIAAASAVLGVTSSLETTRPDGPFPSIHAAKDCKAEAHNIAEKINESRTYARSWSDQAVLVRTHAQISTLTETFVETGIPFTVSTRKSSSAETQPTTSISSDDAVTITTFHASKGLEWPIVHVAGLENGFVPITYATSSHSRDEERRLLYVAMTRAQDQVHCSWARERLFGNRKVVRQPSQFLKDMSHLLEKGNSQSSNGASIREQIHLLRERVFPKRPSRDPDENIRLNLEQWRGHRALAAGVNPQDVISDEALEELITHQPKTREQLNVVPHLNRFKADRYGDEIIKILSDEISE